MQKNWTETMRFTCSISLGELFSLLNSKVKKLTKPYCIQYTLSCCDKIWEDALKTCLLFCISRKLGQSISWEGGIISSLFFYYVIFLPFIITFSHKNILNVDIHFKTAKNVKIFICSLLFLGKNPINFLESVSTVFTHIVSAEDIVIWIWKL